jgi:mersacidin/lichenicidin family type 2 lantibiotic
MDVKVVENAGNSVHITMPAPPAGHMELSDEDLNNAAEGVYLYLKSQMGPFNFFSF